MATPPAPVAPALDPTAVALLVADHLRDRVADVVKTEVSSGLAPFVKAQAASTADVGKLRGAVQTLSGTTTRTLAAIEPKGHCFNTRASFRLGVNKRRGGLPRDVQSPLAAKRCNCQEYETEKKVWNEFENELKTTVHGLRGEVDALKAAQHRLP